MARIFFDVKEVAELYKHAQQAKDHMPDEDGNVKPGLLLVGDQGVYLMSNGLPYLKSDETNPNSPSAVAYAEGLNPHTDEDWWQTKRETFGGDDSAETIPLDAVELVMTVNVKKIFVELTADTIKFGGVT